MSSTAWTERQDSILRQIYLSDGASAVAERIGKTPAAVRQRASRLGVVEKRAWADQEISQLRELYLASGESGVLGLKDFAMRIGKLRSNVCRKARDFGLGTNQFRRKVEQPKLRNKYATKEEFEAARKESNRTKWQRYPHPRGSLGMKHSPETLAVIADKSKQRWESMSDEQKSAHTAKALKAKVAKYGRIAPNVSRGKWKAGWREIGGQRIFFRSRWEANYARYLQWLLDVGQIAKWEHEPHTFWFEGIKRGCVSYLPDFRVTNLNGTHEWHEVKGWMDARSETVLKRMVKYFPSEKVTVIREKEYNALRKQVGAMAGWEE